MIPADLSRAVVQAVRRAVEGGELAAGVPERVVVERTRPGGVGEYASPVALQVAKSARLEPREVARVLAGRLRADEPGILGVEITGPGFLNFSLVPVSATALVREVGVRGPRYGYVPGAEPRGSVVRAAVRRIQESQGVPDGPVPRVAPVARRDGDVAAVYGADAAAWAMLCVPARETPSFTPALLVQDESSEFFRVRYAHARVRALGVNAADLGFRGEAGEVDAPGLLRLLGEYPLVMEAAAHHQAPERLARHLVAVADALLDFQHQVLPKGDEKPSAAHRARLALAEAAGTVLAGGLALLGIDAPEFL
ncbi:ArgS-related anticodon-binding protein NrtL [Streptomyces sp. NPDC047976]|uniref:ArgS-related anticodon-binding protein NrtL n=1 Tax=Streptomyces sp. NPDC047976 TaxID=3155746 RepID=UPI00342B4646